MAFLLNKAFFPPFIAVIRRFKYGISIIPITKYVTRYIIGINIFRIFQPLVVQYF